MERAHAVVLVADDDPGIRMLLADVLSDEGYETVPCRSEAEAIETLRTRVPDLAVLDMQMEDVLSGLRVLTYIRSDPALTHIPVIMYSANSVLLRALIPQIEARDAVALAKPFNIDILVALVRSLLNRRDREAP
jgi:two-component system, response regulator, stage 0 sporulation protein F